jgi:hypothetical protein
MRQKIKTEIEIQKKPEHLDENRSQSGHLKQGLNLMSSSKEPDNKKDYKKVLIIHDFLFQFGGAEKTVEKWLEMYPEAFVLTSFCTPEKFNSSPNFVKMFQENRLITTPIDKFLNFKIGQKKYILKLQKALFWLYPIIMRTKKVYKKDWDLILISSTDCAKQVRIV